MGKRSEWADVRAALESAGFEVRMLQSGHYGVFRGKARVYTMPFSPSDWRGYRNTCAQIKRLLGVEIRQRPKKGQS